MKHLILLTFLATSCFAGCLSEEEPYTEPKKETFVIQDEGPEDVTLCLKMTRTFVERQEVCWLEQATPEMQADTTYKKRLNDVLVEVGSAESERCRAEGVCPSIYMTYDKRAAALCLEQYEESSCSRITSETLNLEACNDMCTYEADKVRDFEGFFAALEELECRRVPQCLSEEDRVVAGYGSTESECRYNLQKQAKEQNLQGQCEDAGLAFNADAAAKCLTQLNELSCGEFAASTVPKICTSICGEGELN